VAKIIETLQVACREPANVSSRHRLCAAVGHAVSFWTWRSLCLDQSLTDTEAVALMTGMVLAITPMSAEPAR
jgi:hypothetical protein